jgi:hypothetical protein
MPVARQKIVSPWSVPTIFHGGSTYLIRNRPPIRHHLLFILLLLRVWGQLYDSSPVSILRVSDSPDLSPICGRYGWFQDAGCISHEEDRSTRTEKTQMLRPAVKRAATQAQVRNQTPGQKQHQKLQQSQQQESLQSQVTSTVTTTGQQVVTHTRSLEMLRDLLDAGLGTIMWLR